MPALHADQRCHPAFAVYSLDVGCREREFEIIRIAFVTGLHRFILDPADPLKEGFLIG